MSYIKLVAHYTETIPGGVHVGAVVLSAAALGNGTAVDLPVPYVPINDRLGIAPAITADGETALRLDFARWLPVRYGRDLVALFPVAFTGQETAVKVARAFDADPATQWRDGSEAITAWLHAWGPANGLALP